MMARMVAYDQVADWYEDKFIGRQTGDPLGISRALGELLGVGDGLCLEIGCGTGVHAGQVHELGWTDGWTAVGVDISAGMLRHAEGRLPIAQADAQRLPFRDGCVPAVIAVMINTDMSEYPAVLREVSRVLKPGGLFVHIGVHPCFCGGFADRTDRDADQGIRAKIGATHRPLPEPLHAFLDAGLTFERFTEGGEPTPVMFAIKYASRRPTHCSILSG